MKRITFKQTLLALVLTGCTASAYAMTVSNMPSGTNPQSNPAITGSGSSSQTVADLDDTDPDDFAPPPIMQTDPASIGDPTSTSTTSPVPEASDAAMMIAGLALLGGILKRRARRS
ncbi:MAG: hypothetical protein ACYCQK_05910 [Acidiferrobacteraceae bacterium]